MPRNGSGTFSLYTPGNPVVTGTTISSTWANNTLNDLATGLTNSLSKDGQTTPTANLPMGTFKLTGLGAGSAATDSLNLTQAQNEAYQLIGTIAGTDTITGSLTPNLTAYAAGQTFRFIAANTNTGATTININSLGAKSITKYGTTALGAGDIVQNASYTIFYDGTQFQLLNPTTVTIPSAFNKAVNTIQDFRLTLTSGTPVTTGDVTGATTIYACPYKGNSIALYDGTNWNLRTSAEFSLALGTITAARPYDVFCYDNAGVPTLEFTAWTNATTRATALTYQDGVLVKTGATTRRYLGTFYTTSTTTTEDSFTKRFLWNYYNRIKRSLLKRDATASWTYTTATPRYANNNAANIVDMVIGVSEDSVSINLDVAFTNSGGNVNISTGIGFDGISTFVGQGGKGATSTAISTVNARFEGYPNIGRHFFSWVESSTAVGTTTWYGTNTSSGIDFYSGLSGSLLG
jgi:hypothetical protein